MTLSMDLKNAKGEINRVPRESDSTPHMHKPMLMGLFFVALSLITGLGFVFVLQHAVNERVWVLFGVYTTLPMVVMLVNFLVNPRGPWRVGSVGALLLPMLLMPWALWHTVFVFCGFVVMSVYGEKIQKTLHNMRIIHAGRALHAGVGGVMMGLALIVSSSYFVTISERNVDELVPRINRVTSISFLMEKYFFTGGQHSMTVDYFLSRTLEDRLEGTRTATTVSPLDQVLFENLGTESLQALQAGIDTSIVTRVTDTALETLQNSFVVNARQDLSDAIGQQLSGKENVIDVILLFTQVQFNKAILGNDVLVAALPKLLAVLFFVTLISFGAFLRFLWVWLTQGVFLLLQATPLFRVTEKVVSVEVISYK